MLTLVVGVVARRGTTLGIEFHEGVAGHTPGGERDDNAAPELAQILHDGLLQHAACRARGVLIYRRIGADRSGPAMRGITASKPVSFSPSSRSSGLRDVMFM